jgi:hypothetical protein
LRLRDNVFEPPWKLSVAPSTAPEDDATVTLWFREAMLVKAMETLPAFAVSDVLSNFSWPSGLAARLSDCPAPPAAGAGVEDAAELDVVGVAAVLGDEEAEEPELLEELPQPARASTPTTTPSIDTVGMERDIARPAALDVTGLILPRLGSSLAKTPHGEDPSSTDQRLLVAREDTPPAAVRRLRSSSRRPPAAARDIQQRR